MTATLTVSVAAYPYGAAAFAADLAIKVVFDDTATVPTLDVDGEPYKGGEEEMIYVLANCLSPAANGTKVLDVLPCNSGHSCIMMYCGAG